LGRAADYAIKRGTGREVTREEAWEILRRSEEAGLVHVTDNRADGGHIICNCCSCCCIVLPVIIRAKKRVLLAPSRFLPDVDTAKCTLCEVCLEVCPVGALSEKTRKWDGKPEREVATTCPLCSAGCQIDLLVKNDMVIGSLPDHAGGSEILCVKGRFGITELVNHPTRLEKPLAVSKEGSVPVPWEQAVEVAAEKISACAPGKYGMVISADCSNETLYIAQKFVREVGRSNHLRTSSTALYGDGLQAIQRLYGLSKPLNGLVEADIILCLGFDGKYAQSVADVKLNQAKKLGAQIITFHSEEHSLSKSADEWLRPAPGDEAQ
jgi:predicted molibdopterin-dependent oxidoreductase YjgC